MAPDAAERGGSCDVARPRTTSCGAARYSQSIHLDSTAPPLPLFDVESPERFPYGARSEAAIFVGDLLSAEVPDLRGREPSLEIVAIARRPGVLSKVALRPVPGVVVPFHVGIGADHLARVSRRLDDERIQVVRWQSNASGYIADALGLGEIPPMLLSPWLRHARVLLGEIDLRGIAGWRGLNAILASALTGWRIRLDSVAGTPAWSRLNSAMRARRPVLATVTGRTDRGLRLEVQGLFATLSGPRDFDPGHELEVRLTRMDPDEGRIFVTDRLTGAANLQLPLPLGEALSRGEGA